MKQVLRIGFLGALLAAIPLAAMSEQEAQPLPEPAEPLEAETEAAETLPTFSMPGWSATEDAYVIRTRAMAAVTDGQLLQLDLDLIEPGYVALVSDENNSPFPGVTIFDGSGLSYQSASARITNPDGAYVVIDRQAGSAAADLTIKAWPDLDLTEPNDDGLLAWPLELGAPTEVRLIPAGDQDVFRFTLAEETHLSIVTDTDQGLQVQFLEPETERQIAYGMDVSLPAGDHLLRLSYGNGNHFDPEPFQFALVERQVAIPVAEDSAPTILDLGVPTYVPTTSNRVARMTMEIEEDGLYSFRASNVGPNAWFEIAREDGDWFRGSDVHLPKGTYTISLNDVRASRYPAMVSVYSGEMGDAYEPNDFHADATELKFDEPIDLVLERDWAVDWVTFTPRRDGNVFLMAEALDYEQGGCLELQVNVLRATDPVELETLTIVGPIAAQTYGPIEATAGTPVHVQIFCNTSGMTQGTTYRVRADMPDLNRNNSNASVYLVGLELDDTLRGAMQMSSDISGVQFLEAEEAETLDERIEEIARAETRSGPSFWLILLILVVLGGGVAAWFFRGRQSASDAGSVTDAPDPEPKPDAEKEDKASEEKA